MTKLSRLVLIVVLISCSNDSDEFDSVEDHVLSISLESNRGNELYEVSTKEQALDPETIEFYYHGYNGLCCSSALESLVISMKHVANLGNSDEHFSIGLYYKPYSEKFDDGIYPESLFTSKVSDEFGEEVLNIGQQEFCANSIFGDYLNGCSGAIRNEAYFELQYFLDDKFYRSGMKEQPTSSFFRIDRVERVDFNSTFGISSFTYKISGEFSCILYHKEPFDRQVTDSIEVTNGTFQLGIWNNSSL